MASSKSLAVVDPAFWEGVSDYSFLDIVQNGVVASPELTLEGTLPTIGKYTYFLKFDPGQTYRLTGNSVSGASQMLLTETATGEILWGNKSALEFVHIDPKEAERSVTVEKSISVTLTVFSLASSVEEAFHLEVFADATPPASEGPGTETPVDPDPGSKPPEPPPPPPPPPPLTDENIYRYVKLSTGQYFYTASEIERESIAKTAPDMRFEGAMFVGDDSPRDGYIPVYRFANVNNGSYFYTAKEAERALIEATQPFMRFEGASFYVPGSTVDDSVTVYRMKNLDTGGYLFTTNLAEKASALVKGGWRDEGIAFEAFPVGHVTVAAHEHPTEVSIALESPQLVVEQSVQFVGAALDHTVTVDFFG